MKEYEDIPVLMRVLMRWKEWRRKLAQKTMRNQSFLI